MYTLRYTVATLNLEESKITEFTASSHGGNALKDGFSPFLKSIIEFLAALECYSMGTSINDVRFGGR